MPIQDVIDDMVDPNSLARGLYRDFEASEGERLHDVLMKTVEGKTLLGIAVFFKHLPVVKWALENIPAEERIFALNAIGFLGGRVLDVLARSGSSDVAEEVFKQLPKDTRYFAAVKNRGHFQSPAQQEELASLPNEQKMLHQAVLSNNSAVIKEVLAWMSEGECFTAMMEADSDGYTPLTWAATLDHDEIIKLFLSTLSPDYAIDAVAKSVHSSSVSPIRVAYLRKKTKAIEALLALFTYEVRFAMLETDKNGSFSGPLETALYYAESDCDLTLLVTTITLLFDFSWWEQWGLEDKLGSLLTGKPSKGLRGVFECSSTGGKNAFFKALEALDESEKPATGQEERAFSFASAASSLNPAGAGKNRGALWFNIILRFVGYPCCL